jgi:hypothetical protein
MWGLSGLRRFHNAVAEGACTDGDALIIHAGPPQIV